MIILILLSTLLLGPARAASIKTRAEFVPLSKFLNDTKQATYKDYLTTAVGDVAAFVEAQKYILARYGGVTHPNDINSFSIGDSYFDCIPFLQQPTIHLLKLAKEKLGEPVDRPVSSTPPPVEKDEFGNTRACVGETVPISRFDLGAILNHATLKDFLSFGAPQAPGGNSTDNAKTAKRRVDVEIDGRKHVNVWTSEHDPLGQISGASARFNIWNPKAFFSLSYLALIAEPTAAWPTPQFIATGWAKHPGKTTTQRFVYFTTNKNDLAAGCFDDRCPGFVHVPAGGIMLGVPYPRTSDVGTTVQLDEEIQIMYSTGGRWDVWILNLGGTRVDMIGYYPTSIFTDAGGNLDVGAGTALFGGEVADDRPRASDVFGEMGSAKMPLPGTTRLDNFGTVAYQRRLKMLPTVLGSWRDVHGAGEFTDDPLERCYNIELETDQDPEWGTNIFFGGKGGRNCDS